MKFQPSAIAATNLSGKSGGTVATITNIFRRKSNPRQPRSSKQMDVRAVFANLSTSWGGLTSTQQDAWIAAAPNYVFYKNGDPYTLKGKALYIKVNFNLLQAGQTVITTPATPATIPAIKAGALTVTEGTPAISLAVTGATSTPSGWTVMVTGTPCFNPGKRSVANKLRVLGTGSIATSAINALSVWEAYPGFGSLVIGQRIEIGFFLINNTTGQATKEQTMQVLIAS